MAIPSDPSPSDLLPWDWQITPADPSVRQCPSTFHIIATYFAATFVTTVLGILLGHQKVVRFMCCGLLGKENSKSWVYMWFIQFLLHFGADILNALMAINTKGYNLDKMPSLWELTLFYASRPRLAWMGIAIFGIHPRWSSAAKQTLISEAFMQLIGCYYMGWTADFATKNNLYFNLPVRDSAKTMYIGALTTLTSTIFSMVGLAIAVCMLAREKERTWWGEKLHWWNRYRCGSMLGVGLMLVFGFVAFASRWVFLVGFVQLAGDLYCPPGLTWQALIWISMNVAGIMLGAGI